MKSPAEQRMALSPSAACKPPLLQIPVAAIHGARSLSHRAEIGRASPTAIVMVMVMDPSAPINHRLKSGQPVGWVEPFAKPIDVPTCPSAIRISCC
jgi:hypothetical protein